MPLQYSMSLVNFSSAFIKSRWSRAVLVSFFVLLLQPSMLADDLSDPAKPQIPEATFSLMDYGAVPGGEVSNTEAFRKAFEACAKAGGGRVVVPSGIFLSGPIQMPGHCALTLENGATLRASQHPEDYKLEGAPEVSTVFNESAPLMRPLIWAKGVTDVAIYGPGTIDGAGEPWWTMIRAEHSASKASLDPTRRVNQTQSPRPRLLLFSDCKRILIHGVTLKDAPNFFLVPFRCEDVMIEDAAIKAPANSPNTDGVDPYDSKNVIIRRCTIDVGDDNVSFKSSVGEPPLENVLVTDCTFLHGHGASVGSNLGSGMRNITVSHCSFDGTLCAIRIKSARDRGNVVENIVYQDITMKNVETAIFINPYYIDHKETDHPQAKPMTATTPIIRNVRILNISCESAKHAGEIVGLPESPVTDLVMKNVHITADDDAFRTQDTKGLVQEDVIVRKSSG